VDALANHLIKTIYILSDNSYLLPGVEALLSTFQIPGVTFTVKLVPNALLRDLLTQLREQKNDLNTVNYFVAEKHVFYVLKSNNASPNGVLIPPTVNMTELEKILTQCNKKISKLNSDFYYRNTHSHREVEVISLLLEGMPQKSIASKLGISIKTVSHHKRIATRKSGFSNFNEYYLRDLSIHPLI
jgi:DNA-binding NarL/FixJ family response regulator